MGTERLDHLHAFGEHVTLRELICRIGCLHHHDRVRASGCALRELADCHFAGSRLHVAQQAKTVVCAEDIFLGQVAVEVQAGQVELLRLGYLFDGEFWRRPHPIDSPEAPGDRGVNLHPPPIQTKQRIRPQPHRRKRPEAKRNGAGVERPVRCWVR